METKTLITEAENTWPPDNERVLCIWEDGDCTIEMRTTVPNHKNIHNKLIQALVNDEGSPSPLKYLYNRIKWMAMPKWED